MTIGAPRLDGPQFQIKGVFVTITYELLLRKELEHKGITVETVGYIFLTLFVPPPPPPPLAEGPPSPSPSLPLTLGSPQPHNYPSSSRYGDGVPLFDVYADSTKMFIW